MANTTNIIRNTNGNTYKILDLKGKYTLLENVKKVYEPFVIAYDLKKIEDGYSWSQGRYYSSLEQAQTRFNCAK